MKFRWANHLLPLCLLRCVCCMVYPKTAMKRPSIRLQKKHRKNRAEHKKNTLTHSSSFFNFDQIKTDVYYTRITSQSHTLLCIHNATKFLSPEKIRMRCCSSFFFICYSKFISYSRLLLFLSLFFGCFTGKKFIPQL